MPQCSESHTPEWPGVIALAAVCLGLPLLGAWLMGVPWKGFWSLPLESRDMGYTSFSLTLNVVYWLIFVFLVLWWWRGHRSAPAGRKVIGSVRLAPLPWWGWVALLALVLFWWLAWTRYAWFAPLQSHTFTPIWLSFIVLLNAFVVVRSGTCPMLERPRRFTSLFLVSAAFWWVFEYFNRFVHNWLYHGVEEWSPAAYALHATLAFSTVLPAVYSMARLLETFPGLQGFLARGPCLPGWMKYKRTACIVLAITATGFFFIGILPQIFFPLLWGGPILVWLCLNRLFGHSLNLGGITHGNWRWALNWALAGLLCGFCWECWNLYSLAKWTYQIPWFETMYIFEMPLAGYLGYLPFGLECGLAVGALYKITIRN